MRSCLIRTRRSQLVHSACWNLASSYLATSRIHGDWATNIALSNAVSQKGVGRQLPQGVLIGRVPDAMEE